MDLSQYAGKQHDFRTSLEKSHAQAKAPWWYEVYKKAFPDMRACVDVRQDGWAQRGGIDRVITLASGKTINVDEKVREEDWPDIALEYWSDVEHKIPGWIAKDLACDFIAYAFVPSQTCYLLPFQTLRAAWRKNGAAWVRDFQPPIRARNNGYTTICVAVPTEVLLQALGDAMAISWAETQLES